jgi:hypothetical protein
MSGVSGRVSVPQRRDAREAIYEPPDRSLWPLALVRDEGGGEQRLLVALRVGPLMPGWFMPGWLPRSLVDGGHRFIPSLKQ